MSLDKHNRINHTGPRDMGRKDGCRGGGKIKAKEESKVIRRLDDKKIIRQELKQFPEFGTIEWERMSVADHAEAWWQEQGNEIPTYPSIEWNKMYEKWIDYAFEGI